MGNQLSTCFGCCPQENNEDNGDAYDETSPLLGGGNGASNGLNYNRGGQGQGGLSADLASSNHDSAIHPGSYRQGRSSGADTRNGGSYAGNEVVGSYCPNKPTVLSDILEDGADTIIDCTEAGKDAGTSHVASLAGNAHNAANVQAKSVAYGKRLSAVASALAQKHLANPYKPMNGGNGGLVDLGSDGDRALSQAPDDILSETDQVLANEVASRAHETVADFRVEPNSEIVVPFGARNGANA